MATTTIPADWWQTFFNDDYAFLWSECFSDTDTQSQAAALWELLDLHENTRVLDAGCGYGRLSLPTAKMGAVVTGIDQSQNLLAIAERDRSQAPNGRLRYVHHDLRTRLTDVNFDAALNVFTGIGFGTEEDDLAILATIHDAIRPGGRFFLEAIQRDAVAAFFSRGGTLSRRRPDGILVFEESTYDPIASRLNGTWYWAGAGTSGVKSASMRIYTIGELIQIWKALGSS